MMILSNKRSLLGSWSALVIFTLLLFASSLWAEQNKPNILLIVADDLGYEMLGCYGGHDTATPTLDRLASEGTQFMRTYASAVCTPSRMSLYTGTYVPRHGYTDVLPVHVGSREAVDFETEFKTLAQVLRADGYATSVTGKWQLAALEYHPEHCRSAGFDSWCIWKIWHNDSKTKRYWNPTYVQDGEIVAVDEDSFGPDIMTDFIIEQMHDAKANVQPFFIQHNMVLPHTPIVKTPDDKLNDKAKSLKNMIAYMDKQVARLVDATKAMGISEDTVILFIGDNGTQSKQPRMTDEGAVTGGKWKLNDGGTHVPFIAYGPGLLPQGMKIWDLVDIVDLFPTLCDLVGVDVPDGAAPDGISFSEVLLGTGEGEREWVTAAIGGDFSVFDGQWRLHHRGEQLIDCRELPLESVADMSSPDAQQAKAKLLPALEDLRQLAPKRD